MKHLAWASDRIRVLTGKLEESQDAEGLLEKELTRVKEEDDNSVHFS